MRMVLILLLLAACNTPGPHFRGVPAVRVAVSGSVFDVRIREDLGEAIRVNAQYAPRFGPIAGRAKAAIASVSGCDVYEILGDQTYALGKLDCGKGRQAEPYRAPTYVPVSKDKDCIVIDKFDRPWAGEKVLDLQCYPVF